MSHFTGTVGFWTIIEEYKERKKGDMNIYTVFQNQSAIHWLDLEGNFE
jgi:hypothetical protein